MKTVLNKQTHTGRWLTAALLGGVLMAVAPGTSHAAPVSGSALQTQAAGVSGNQNIEKVQYRRHWRGGHRYHNRHRHHRGWRGPGAGLGIGLATGALIGGAIASQGAYARSDAHEYCASRFKSYDPRSGTYLGYDGNRHACP